MHALLQRRRATGTQSSGVPLQSGSFSLVRRPPTHIAQAGPRSVRGGSSVRRCVRRRELQSETTDWTTRHTVGTLPRSLSDCDDLIEDPVMHSHSAARHCCCVVHSVGGLEGRGDA